MSDPYRNGIGYEIEYEPEPPCGLWWILSFFTYSILTGIALGLLLWLWTTS